MAKKTTTTDTKPISFRCPPELKSKLEDLAYLSRRDVSSILIEVCSALVDANKERIIKFRQSASQPLKLPMFATPTKKKVATKGETSTTSNAPMNADERGEDNAEN